MHDDSSARGDMADGNLCSDVGARRRRNFRWDKALAAADAIEDEELIGCAGSRIRLVGQETVCVANRAGSATYARLCVRRIVTSSAPPGFAGAIRWRERVRYTLCQERHLSDRHCLAAQQDVIAVQSHANGAAAR